MKQLIFSIISDQTIPNIQVINEFRDENTEYMMLSTPSMQHKGVDTWIAQACTISPTVIICNNEYDLSDIEKQIASKDYSQYDQLTINLTGGTKLMSMAVFNYFAKFPHCKMVYVPTPKREKPCYKEIFPQTAIKEFTAPLNINDYLNGYGYNYKTGKLSGLSIEYSKAFCDFFCHTDMSQYDEAMLLLRKYRNKGKGVTKEEDFQRVKPLLTDSHFTPQEEGKLSDVEVQYLTGGWFEEYVYFRIKEELGIADDCIVTGALLTRNTMKSNEKLYEQLLGEELTTTHETANEFDVMFVYHSTLFVIECKTSIINKIADPAGSGRLKEENILGKTIYQVDSLKNKLGLYASAYIFTLSDFRTMRNVEDKGKRNDITNHLIELIDRATYSHISIADRHRIINAHSLLEII